MPRPVSPTENNRASCHINLSSSGLNSNGVSGNNRDGRTRWTWTEAAEDMMVGGGATDAGVQESGPGGSDLVPPDQLGFLTGTRPVPAPRGDPGGHKAAGYHGDGSFAIRETVQASGTFQEPLFPAWIPPQEVGGRLSESAAETQKKGRRKKPVQK